MKEKFRKFMAGRYGVDSFGKFLLIPMLILLILGNIYRNSFLNFGVLLILIYSYYRMLSKDISKRYRENQKFLELTKPITKKFNSLAVRFRDRKDYKYTTCPYCNLQMRIPRNKGKVIVRCKRCKEKFEFRT